MTLASPDRPLFETVLRPHRSLSPAAFRLVMALVLGVNAVLGVGFLAAGAWPIFGFCGLDVLLVWLAFRASYRIAAQRWEHLTLTEAALTVERAAPRRALRRWRFQPAWLAVRLDDPPKHESQLTLASHGRSLTVGAFLAPEQRQAVAAELRAALERLKRAEHLR